MAETWVISDTHFFHKNILSFTDNQGNRFRGDVFKDAHDMNNTMLENWNSLVKPGDNVYHLGDVFMGKKEDFIPFWKRLNGSKRLILGNHDDAKFFAKNELVTKILMWKMFPEMGLLFTHVPIHESGLGRYNQSGEKIGTLLNVHGHIHQNPSPTPHHRCVCVEQIDYTPINIDELRVW